MGFYFSIASNLQLKILSHMFWLFHLEKYINKVFCFTFFILKKMGIWDESIKMI